MTPSRRFFLGGTLAGAGLLALGGVGLSAQSSVMVAPDAPLRALTPRQFSVLVAVADRVCPGGGALPVAREVGVAGAIDRLLSTMHPGDAAELGQALDLIENAAIALVLDGRARPFTACDPAAQDAALRAWATSGITLRRKAFLALKGLIASAYHANPATYAGVGYPGPPPGLVAGGGIP